ncbi:MAG TPA: M48 family metalloprotease [Streptosporangiaceae bacterium]
MHGNVLRTAILFAVLGSLILAVGATAGGSDGLIIAVLVALGVCGIAYFWSDRIALSAMRSRPVSEWEYPQLYRLVRELSSIARTPAPRLYVSPALQPNAFATGRNRRTAAVCCTEGILRTLDPDELRGVLGHELSHVHSRDILISSVAAGLATVITFLAALAWLLPFGRGGGRLLKLAFMLVLGPVAALLIQLAIARTREYQADAAGVRLTGDPLALARALRKIELGTEAHPLVASGPLAAAGHLMIVAPFRSAGLGRLFSTHPPVAERVRRLESLAGCPR